MVAGSGVDADGCWNRERSISLCKGLVGRVRVRSRLCRIMCSMMHSSSRRSVRPSIRALFPLIRSFVVLNGACNGYCTPKNASEPSYHVRVSIPTFPSLALSPPIALRCLLLRRNLQIHHTRHNGCPLCGTGLPATANILSRAPDAVLIFRARPDEQLYREPVCGLDTAAPHSAALYQYGRRHTELAGSNYA